MPFDLNDLNPEQRQAVTSTDGALLVLAGAGSGKTRVITSRIAYLIENKGVAADAILAVTFTNKAAREMTDRVGAMIRRGKKRPTISTFHAFGMKLLRAHIHKLGYRDRFVIMDDQDQLAVVKSVLEDGDYDLALYAPKNVHFSLQQAKSRGTPAEELLAPNQPPDQQMLGMALKEYQETLKRLNAVDFEDILQLSLKICLEHPEAARDFFRQYRYVLVDEYQDTNRAQYDLVRHLTAEHGNLCVVGDDDQSIYKWRGADPGNILDFERDFPGTRVVNLERNYRSTDTILSAANQVISRNSERKEKRLRGVLGPGDPLEWILGEDEGNEMEKVVTHLKSIRLHTGAPYSDFAILYRSNHQSRIVEENLREFGIPYLLVGGTRFYDRKEVKDALAYLRLAHNPDDEVSLMRVINFPRRGIGRTSQMRLAEYAETQNRKPFEVMGEATRFAGFTPEAGRSMEHMAATLSRYGERLTQEPLGETFREMLTEIGFHSAVEGEKKDKNSRERASGLVRELELAVGRYAQNRPEATLGDYLEHVALFTLPIHEEEGKTPNMVTLMTVHGAKGLEFPYVYLVGLADDLFPHKRALAEGGEEEERRLFYVAITRARRRLVMSMAKFRKRWGEKTLQQPSRFLGEIDPALFDGDAPGLAAPPKEVKERKAKHARARFFENVRKLKEVEAGD